MGLSTEISEAAIKAAKGILMKKGDGNMKIKELAKEVLESLQVDSSTTPKKVKKVLAKSDTFNVDGKFISLSTNKRNPLDDTNETPLKKQKKDDESPLDMVDWRTRHKIVLKDTLDDDSSALNDMKIYYPYTTFQAASATIPQSLLSHCTVKNGFTTPSPIQAQCWPVLLEQTSDGTRDVVGIAETGSGKIGRAHV